MTVYTQVKYCLGDSILWPDSCISDHFVDVKNTLDVAATGPSLKTWYMDYASGAGSLGSLGNPRPRLVALGLGAVTGLNYSLIDYFLAGYPDGGDPLVKARPTVGQTLFLDFSGQTGDLVPAVIATNAALLDPGSHENLRDAYARSGPS